MSSLEDLFQLDKMLICDMYIIYNSYMQFIMLSIHISILTLQKKILFICLRTYVHMHIECKKYILIHTYIYIYMSG